MTYTVTLDEYDYRMLLHAMKNQHRQIAKKERRNERTGWTPEPGKSDSVAGSRARFDDLYARLKALTPE